MGFLDFFRRQSADRQSRQAAIDIALRSGVIQRCPVCHALYDRQNDGRLPAADAEAHAAFDRHDPAVAIFAGDRERLLRLLREVREPLPYACDCEDQG